MMLYTEMSIVVQIEIRIYIRVATDGCTSANLDHASGTELLNVQVKRIGGLGFFFINFPLTHVRALGSAPRFNEG